MKLLFTERPSALPAAHTQVVTAPGRITAPVAHVPVVGRTAVRTRITNDIPQLQVLTQQIAASRNVGGFAGSGIDRGDYVMTGASGVPPRGRPV